MVVYFQNHLSQRCFTSSIPDIEWFCWGAVCSFQELHFLPQYRRKDSISLYVSILCRAKALSFFLLHKLSSWQGKSSMNVVVVSHDGLQRSCFHSSYRCDKLARSRPSPAQLNSWCAQTRLTAVVVHLPLCLRHISSTITILSLASLNEQCVKTKSASTVVFVFLLNTIKCFPVCKCSVTKQKQTLLHPDCDYYIHDNRNPCHLPAKLLPSSITGTKVQMKYCQCNQKFKTTLEVVELSFTFHVFSGYWN